MSGVVHDLQIQDKHIGPAARAKQLTGLAGIRVHDYRRGRAAYEYFLQSYRDATLMAQYRGCKASVF